MFRKLFAVFVLFMLGHVAPAFATDPNVEIIKKASVSAAAASGVTSTVSNEVSVTVPGAILGDARIASHSVDTTGLAITCKITAANTAKVTFVNTTTNGVALASGTTRVFLFSRGTR